MSLIVNNYYPLDYLALAGVSQPQSADPRNFWSSIESLPPAIETLTFDLGGIRPINCVDFEIIGKPIDLEIQYLSGSSWITVTDNSDFNNEQSLVYLGGENPWVYIERHFETVSTQKVKITFTRRSDPFPFADSDLFPWSIDVRNLRIMHLIDSINDFIADTGKDILGNTYRTIAHTYDSTNMTDGDPNTYWKSFPNSDPSAVECVHLDLRQSGNAIVIDEIYIDPITYGPYMHIYYSNDDSTSDWDSKLWVPVPNHYILKKGFFSLASSTLLKYLKLEFSNLTPIPYNTPEFPDYHSFTYRKFPTWVQNYFTGTYWGLNSQSDLVGLLDQVLINPLEFGFTIPNDMLSPTALISNVRITDPTRDLQNFIQGVVSSQEQIPETQQELESQISFRNSFSWQTDLMDQLDQDRALTRLLLQNNTTTSFQSEGGLPVLAPPEFQSVPDLTESQNQKQMPIMWFPMTCRHAYQIVKTNRTSKIAYYVGIKEVSAYRRDYTIASDPDNYVEIFGDSQNIQQNDFIQSDLFWVVGS